MATLSKTQVVEAEYAAYLPGLHRHWLNEQVARQGRYQAAWAAARAAAALLYSRFGAQQVLAFGSLVHPDLFDMHSDIDLAVTGISASQFFKAWAAVGAQCPFDLDLVDLADCSPALHKLIVHEGAAL